MSRPLPILNATIAAVLLIVSLFLAEAKAEGIRLFSELEYLYTDSEITEKATGRVLDSRSSNFSQLYNLDISKSVYPYLSISGGGIFELDETLSTSDGIDVRDEERTIRPFFGIDLDNPLYRASGKYVKTKIKEKTTGLPDERNFREEYIGFFGWKPVDLPTLTLQYTWTHTYDSPMTIDRFEKLLSADSRYAGLENFLFRYTYTRLENEERLNDFETLLQFHEGRVNYSRALIDKRLTLDTGYKIQYATDEFGGAGTGNVPITRSAGLFSLDDTPDDGPALQPLSSLIDGNLTVSSGINIGLNGDRSTLSNIGIDFGFPSQVDRIFLWVDRSLTSAVSDSFSFEVYVSSDNTDMSIWTLHATVFPATFGAFQDRFEISIPSVTTRFIKIVTRPLSPAVVGSSGFPDIFVTEIEGFTAISGQADRLTTIDHIYNLDLRWRASDRTVLTYDFFYKFEERDPSSIKRTQVSNSISANHIFSRVYTGRLRLLREDTRELGEESEVYTYNASLRADHLDTFQQTLTYSGSYTIEEEGNRRDNALFLRNRADLYEGWSAYLDTGYSWVRSPEGRDEDNTTITVGTNMSPNEKITINTNYSIVFVELTDQGVTSSDTEQRLNVDLLLLPLRTLSLFARLSYIDEEDSTRSFQSYSANWSPFPDGTFQFFFNYNETFLTAEDLDERERTITPGVRWDVTRFALLELSYTIFESDTLLERENADSFLVNLRVVL